MEEFALTFSMENEHTIDDPYVIEHMRLKKFQLVNLGSWLLKFKNFRVNRSVSKKLVWLEFVQIGITKCEDCADLVSEIKCNITYTKK